MFKSCRLALLFLQFMWIFKNKPIWTWISCSIVDIHLNCIIVQVASIESENFYLVFFWPIVVNCLDRTNLNTYIYHYWQFHCSSIIMGSQLGTPVCANHFRFSTLIFCSLELEWAVVQVLQNLFLLKRCTSSPFTLFVVYIYYFFIVLRKMKCHKYRFSLIPGCLIKFKWVLCT